MPNRLTRAVTVFYDTIIRYLLKFGVVGAIGYVVDIGVFNLLLLSGVGPLWSKVISVAVATVLTWFGNRYWTFREHRRSNYIRELLEFSAVAVAGLLINVVTLWFTHYVLGFTSVLADNVSGNFIGTGLATLFRFALYRYWVFGHHRTGIVESTDRADGADVKAEVAAAAIFEDDSFAEADVRRDTPQP
ncbi:GtrA family protein [Subtercola sp. YIM 133946]|uniref:GtrA family protein n=1 Tax=Subtercola sp. YIM 133946 TaxID=3118909 RepID=UPI002F91D70A